MNIIEILPPPFPPSLPPSSHVVGISQKSVLFPFAAGTSGKSREGGDDLAGEEGREEGREGGREDECVFLISTFSQVLHG